VIAVGRLHQVPATIEGEVARSGRIPHDISPPELMQHLTEVMPAADLLLGGGMVVLIMLVHAAGVRVVTHYVLHRSKVLLARPRAWRVDVLMSVTVFMLLGLHLLEMFGWTAALDPASAVGVAQRRSKEPASTALETLGRIGRVGHRITGDRRDRVRGIGWEYVHVAVDDATRLAYVEVLPDEQGVTVTAFLWRARTWFRQLGFGCAGS
jgi:hypothetical protein